VSTRGGAGSKRFDTGKFVPYSDFDRAARLSEHRLQGNLAKTSRPFLLRAGREVQGLAEIKITDNESIESALRRFKRRVQQEDIIKEIKKHSFYMKPGDKRRAKQALARKRQRKKQRREQTD
jgi:small subunit ribosomal protein S21